MHATENNTRLDVERNNHQMESPVCNEIALTHVFVSLRLYEVLVFVANVKNLAEQSEQSGGDHSANYQENFNPEPRFERTLLTCQIVSALAMYVEPVMIDASQEKDCHNQHDSWGISEKSRVNKCFRIAAE